MEGLQFEVCCLCSVFGVCYLVFSIWCLALLLLLLLLLRLLKQSLLPVTTVACTTAGNPCHPISQVCDRLLPLGAICSLPVRPNLLRAVIVASCPIFLPVTHVLMVLLTALRVTERTGDLNIHLVMILPYQE